ncbi:YARHG domain-containing protein [Schleiferiaceae bacterium]|nr:YARHG domain-containing protein [Schleiferiaceae bacterium]
MKPILLTIQLLVSTLTWGQYYSDLEVSPNQLTPWTVDSLGEYSRTYHFGFSEGECELRIFVDDTTFAAQSSCYTWRESLGGFIDTFYTFNNVRINGTKFYSQESNGEFMVLNTETGQTAGLILYKPWTYQFYAGGEFGSVLPDDNSVYLVGDYPEASKRILTERELDRLNLDQLQIMRNEIYARYGYKFREGGSMDTHFKNEKWYRGNYNAVEQWFTVIELKNLDTIKKIEKEKTAANKG